MAIVDGIESDRSMSVIRLGILTPTLRVLLTWLLFLLDHDWPFVLITSIVLAVLVLRLLGQIG